jgi:tetratricopeptide (TPR) repeat protein
MWTPPCVFLILCPPTMTTDQANHQQLMSRALSRIELFLLPANNHSTTDDGGFSKPSFEENSADCPTSRLDQTLYQVALADYIRTIQTMYRDAHDEQKLAAPLRADPDAKLPTKHLISKILEGRTRASALVRVGFGDSSIAMLKGVVDVASSYALQGLWPQVGEKVNCAHDILRKIVRVRNNQFNEEQQRIAYAAAERISCVYDTLRTFAIRSNGQVTKAYVKEIMFALVQLPSHREDELPVLGHPSKFAAALHAFFNSYKGRTFGALKHTDYADSYFPDQNRGKVDREDKTEPKSWGNVVDFLRSGQCEPMNSWVEALYELVLPQDRAALALPFRMCDLQMREIAHPVQLSHVLLSFPGAARVLNGSKLTKALSQIKVEVPIYLEARTGNMLDFVQLQEQHQQAAAAGRAPPALPPMQQVFYELPITKEEFFALYVLMYRPTVEAQLDLLRVQLYTIDGVCHIYTSELEAAEDALKRALNLLEKHGLEMEIVACELYNSIAQMMIMQHRKWVAGRKDRLREEATLWLETEEGKREIKQQTKILRRHYSYKTAPITTGEIEMRSKNAAIKRRVNVLSTQQDDSKDMNKTLEAAYRYLVRSYEILEATHGAGHPSVGTACLAVASVQNILEDYEDTRTWLMKALRYFEKYSPLPHRAISFTQVQLSQVLSKLGHDDQARMVLSNAALFHMSQAHVGLLNHHTPQVKRRAASPQHRLPTEEADASRPETARSNATSRVSAAGAGGAADGAEGAHAAVPDTTNYSMVSPPILKNTALFEEVSTAIELMSRVMRMSTKCFDKWQAATQSEEIAKLTEAAFGWDSPEGAEAFKQVHCITSDLVVAVAEFLEWLRCCAGRNTLRCGGRLDSRLCSLQEQSGSQYPAVRENGPANDKHRQVAPLSAQRAHRRRDGQGGR